MRTGSVLPVCAAALTWAVTLSGCTTVGMHTKERTEIDYGAPLQMRVCVLHAPGVTPERVNQLVAAVNTEFVPYAIEVVVPWVRPWTRSGFTETALFDDMVRRDLEAPCDRLIALVDRNFGDFVWGLLMPEILGAVDTATHTRGYIVATTGSLNQLFEPPSAATVHEFYHLLGCPHAMNLTHCYRQIADLKRHVEASADFVPGIAVDGRFLLTRDSANAWLRAAVAHDDEKRARRRPK